MELLTDDELCDRLRISKETLRKHLKDGPPKRRNMDTSDVRAINKISIGGQRRWLKSSVDSFIQGNKSTTQEA